MKVKLTISLILLISCSNIFATEIRLIKQDGSILDTKFIDDNSTDIYIFGLFSFDSGVTFLFGKMNSANVIGEVEAIEYLFLYNINGMNEIAIIPKYSRGENQYLTPQIVKDEIININFIVKQEGIGEEKYSYLSFTLFGPDVEIYKYIVSWNKYGKIEDILRVK